MVDINTFVPQTPGPNALGHDSIVGQVRRQNGYPVLRDEFVEQVDDLEAVNLPNQPVLPVLSRD